MQLNSCTTMRLRLEEVSTVVCCAGQSLSLQWPSSGLHDNHDAHISIMVVKIYSAAGMMTLVLKLDQALS